MKASAQRRRIILGLNPLLNQTSSTEGLLLSRTMNYFHILMDDNRKNKNWMFFVCPIEEENTKQLVGNHFSFCISKNDAVNACHFHSTFYRRHGATIISHSGCLFLERALLIRLLGTMLIYNTRIHSLTSFTGGAKDKTIKAEQGLVARPIISQAFADRWNACAFKNMVAIGLPSGTNIKWCVRFQRRGRRPKNRLQNSYVFDLSDSATEATFQDTLAHLIRNE